MKNYTVDRSYFLHIRRFAALFAAAVLLITSSSLFVFSARAGERQNGFYHGGLSSGEIRVYNRMADKFDAMRGGKYSKKEIFAAAVGIKTGKVVFASDRDFFYGRKISPGSIIKIFDYAIILKHIKNAAGVKFYCKDESVSGGRRYNCSQKGGHGEVDLESAFYNSCNLYFKKFMGIIPRREFTGALKKCGFIDEAAERSLLKASSGRYLQAVIGDGPVKVSPQKLTELVTFLAASDSPAISGAEGYRFVFDGGSAEKINFAMRKVVTRGTAFSAMGGADCAAKTGSAGISTRIENGKKLIITSGVFLCYTPYINPEYAIIAFCEPGTGGIEAAAVARELISAIGEPRVK